MTSSRTLSTGALLRLPLQTEIYLILVAILFTAIYFFVPPQHDDLWYMQPYFGYLRGETPFSLKDGMPGLLWHYEYDNARLANMSTPLTLVLLPRWIFNMLSGIMVWAMLRFSVLMSDYPGREKVPASSGILLISTLVLLLPWYNFILTADFTLNYVWTGAGFTFTMYMIMRPEIFRDIAWPWKVMICVFILLAGAMHEGASTIVCIGSGLIIVFARGNRQYTAIRLLLLGLFAIGTAYVCLAPAILNKLAHETTDTPGISLMAAIRASALPIMFCSCIVAVALVGKWRRKVNRHRWTMTGIYMTMALVMEWLLLYSGLGGDRVMWFGDLAAGIGIFTLLNPLCRTYGWKLATGIYVVLTITNLGFTLYYQAKLMSEFRKVTTLMSKSRTHSVIVTPLTGADFLPFDLGKPVKTQFSIRYNLLNELYGHGQRISLIPHKVARTPVEEMKRVGEHFLTAGPFIVATDTLYGKEQYETYVHLRYADGIEMTLPGIIHPFIRNSHQYYYIDAPRPRLFYSREIENVK